MPSDEALLAPLREAVGAGAPSYAGRAREVKGVYAAFRGGSGLPDGERPARDPGERATPMSRAARESVEALREWRDAQAKASKLDPSIVMPQRLIDRIAVAQPTTLAELAAVEGIRQWRVTEWGPALLAACA